MWILRVRPGTSVAYVVMRIRISPHGNPDPDVWIQGVKNRPEIKHCLLKRKPVPVPGKYLNLFIFLVILIVLIWKKIIL